MALWNVNGQIIYTEGALSITPTGPGSVFARRHTYMVPRTNVGKGGFIMKDSKKFHVPSWIEVHPETSFDDIMVEEKLFEELFIEPKSWEFKSSTGDKTYTVKQKKDGALYCDCWGYIGHKKCKHITEVRENKM